MRDRPRPDALRRGDVLGATNLLRAGAVLASGLPDGRALADELASDADAMEEQSWTDVDAKRMFSRSRGTFKGRRTDYSGPADPQA